MIMSYEDQEQRIARRVAVGRIAFPPGFGLDNERPPYATSAPDYVARWGATPPPVGTVLRWTGANGLTWVAIHGESGWTRDGDDIQMSFADLARHVVNHPCDVAIAWRAVPQIEARPAGDEAVRDWAAQFIPATPDEVTDASQRIRKINEEAMEQDPCDGH